MRYEDKGSDKDESFTKHIVQCRDDRRPVRGGLGPKGREKAAAKRKAAGRRSRTEEGPASAKATGAKAQEARRRGCVVLEGRVIDSYINNEGSDPRRSLPFSMCWCRLEDLNF